MAKRSKAVREIDAMMQEATRQLADLDASRQAVAARLDTLGKLAAKLERAPVVKKLSKARQAAAFEKMRQTALNAVPSTEQAS